MCSVKTSLLIWSFLRTCYIVHHWATAPEPPKMLKNPKLYIARAWDLTTLKHISNVVSHSKWPEIRERRIYNLSLYYLWIYARYTCVPIYIYTYICYIYFHLWRETSAICTSISLYIEPFALCLDWAMMLAGASIAVNAAVTTRKAVSFLKEVANIEDCWSQLPHFFQFFWGWWKLVKGIIWKLIEGNPNRWLT